MVLFISAEGAATSIVLMLRPAIESGMWHAFLGDMWNPAGPKITDGVIYIGSSYQHVIRAYNASNGKVIWQTNVDYRVNDKPLVLDDFVIIGTEHDTDVKLGTICVLDKTTGKIISRISAGGQVYILLLSYNDLIYYGCTDGNIYALDKEKITNVPVINLKVQ